MYMNALFIYMCTCMTEEDIGFHDRWLKKQTDLNISVSSFSDHHDED